MSSDRCAWPRCREVMHLIYFEKPLCEQHWGMVSEMSPKKLQVARTRLGIRVEVKEVKGVKCNGENTGETDCGRGDGDVGEPGYEQGHLFGPLRTF
jgi:hypothetical protein